MKRPIFIFFGTFFALLPLFSQYNPLESADRIAAKELVSNTTPLNYDIETLDIYGNHQFYHYDDFEYQDDILTEGYFPENLIRQQSEFEKYYSLPYSAICTVYSTYDTNNDGLGDTTYVGSGSLVGPDEVLTAEENTSNLLYGNPIDMYFAFGEHLEGNNLVRPFGVQHWVMIMRGNYHNTLNVNDNWALIRIDTQVGYSTGWLGVSDTGILNGSSVKAIGYNNITDNEATIYQGFVSSLQMYKFNYNVDPPMMANGGPVMNNTLQKVLGIHSSQRTVVNNVTLCQACKISIYIKGWIQEDCGPLKITIFADADSGSSGSFTGHAWISVKNNSPFSYQIGRMTILPNTAVSLGTWGNTTHIGLYYNLEYDRTHGLNDYFATRVSYSRNIFSSQWDNNYVIENDEWDLYDNCASFATSLWNTILPLYPLSCGSWPMPSNLKYSIEQYDGYEIYAEVGGTSAVGYYEDDVFVYSIY